MAARGGQQLCAIMLLLFFVPVYLGNLVICGFSEGFKDFEGVLDGSFCAVEDLGVLVWASKDLLLGLGV